MVETMLAKAEKDISSECEWLNESKAEVQKAYDRINEKACEIINQ